MGRTPYAAGSLWSRGGGLSLAILIHLVLLLLIVVGMAPALVPRQRRESIPVVFLPRRPPPPLRSLVARVLPRRHPGGGAPARAAPPPTSPPLPTHFFVDVPAPLVDVDPIAASAGPLPPILPAASDAGAGAGVGMGAGGMGTGTGAGIGPGSDAAPGLMHAVWLHRPTSVEMLPYWPEAATRSRRSGEVLLACEVPVPGAPRRCLTICERPRHVGFGAAAVKLSSLFRIKPVTRGGDVASGWVLVPVSFDFLSR